jgi:hypothetical protein
VTRAAPLGRSRRARRAFTAFAVVVATAIFSWGAPSASAASQPLSFDHMVGLPRHSVPEDVAVDSNGDVYVTESSGTTTTTDDRVAKYDTDGTLLDIVAVPGTGTGQVANPNSIAFAPNGDLYVLENGYGTGGTNEVSYYDSSGNYLGKWGLYGTGNGAFKTPQGIAVDSTGAVYVADLGNDRIQKFSSTGTWVNAWTVNNVSDIAVDSTDTIYAVGSATVSRFTSGGAATGSPTSWSSNGATGIAIDSSDNIWVTSSAGVIHRYDGTGASLGDICSSGTLDGKLQGPQGIFVTTSGTVFVADTGNGRIQRLGSDCTFQAQWGRYPGPGVEDAPVGVATDAANNVYVTDKADDLIQKFDSTGAYLLSWGGSGAAAGSFADATSIAITPGGNVVVLDTKNYRVQEFDPSGGFVRQWGSGGTGDGQFGNYPQGIAIDISGNIYVADTGNNRIESFASDGTFIMSWGTSGTGDGQFNAPRGLAIDGGGDVWVADSANNRIQEFGADGTFLSKWGQSGSGDGRLSQPYDLDFDPEGSIWVADRGHDRIQRFTTAGVFLAKIGTTGLDLTEFNTPSGVEVDDAGIVLVADTANNRVQALIDANGPDVTITSGPPTVSNQTTASFSFTANEPGATFECKLDSGSWASCTSGDSFSSIPEGPHTMTIRGIDSLSNVGNPATYDWTIDLTPPTVSMDTSPDSPTASTAADFTYHSSEAGSTFLCSLDAAVPSSCGASFSGTALDGDHSFSVWAVDPAGNQSGSAASYSWTVDTTPPVVHITGGPTGYVQATHADFTFDSPEGTATFECHVDGAAYAACTSPASYTGLSAGSHTFYVHAIDVLGNVSTDKTQSWTVDLATHRPDALIGTGSKYIGNNVYNATATNQTKTVKTGPGKTVTFAIRVQNDGSDADSFIVQGGGSEKGYAVSYFVGVTDYTTKIVNGTYKFSLDPGTYKSISMKVKVGSAGKASWSSLVKVTAELQPTKVDAVKGVIKRT